MKQSVAPAPGLARARACWRARSLLGHALANLGHRLKAAEGFTVIESLAAAVVVVVGLLGAFLLLDVASATSAATRARSGGVNLAREITEDSRSIPFSQLAPSTIVTQLQGMPGLAPDAGATTWQITRNGFQYTANATECSVDDPKDGYGVHDSTFCSDSTVPTGTVLTDPTPIDMKRVTVTVTWSALHQTHSVTEVATLTSAGQTLGLQVSGLSAVIPGGTGPVACSGPQTITDPTVTSMTFQVTAPAGTTQLVWSVDGAVQPWTSSPAFSGVAGTFTSSPWSITGLSDGTYRVGVAAEDANNVIGPAVTCPVTLIRNIPAAPKLSATLGSYGFNTNLMFSGLAKTVAELQWQPNTEQNVIGYRIWNPSGQRICDTTQGGANATTNQTCGPGNVWCATPAACIDLSAPSPTASNLTYQVAALYHDASGAVQESPHASATMTGAPSDTYSFAPTKQNNDGNCVATGITPKMDMRGVVTLGTTDSTATGSITFCSDAANSGDTVEGGGKATGYFVNSGASPCVVTATLSTNGSTTGAVTGTATIPNGTTSATAFLFTFTNPQLLTMNAGDRLDLNFNMSTPSCTSTTLHYGSTGAPSLFVTAASPITPPGPPGAPSATTQTDGSVVITWAESSVGAPVSFYRVYRDGLNYTNRYDVAPTADCDAVTLTCTYTDAKRTTTHAYYITAVGGTTPGSNMAESLQVGPATG
jgi:Tfp pilus assembly protein PilV